MNILTIGDKAQIAAYLRRFPEQTIYQLGDLDPFFWDATHWFTAIEHDSIQALALLYDAPDLPVLLAMTVEHDVMPTLITAIQHELPNRLYAHLSDDVAQILAQSWRMIDHGKHDKMVLRDHTKLPDGALLSDVMPLHMADLAAIERLYQHYKGNWFDSRMLETGCYCGVWHKHELISIAGVHVYSPEYGVAALGNITTHPAWRGRGLAQRTTAKLCQHLLETVTTVGLNVKSDNHAAIACYRALGFERVTSYGEWLIAH